MKKLILIPSLLILLMFLLGSCSVHKRVYRDGYQIEWNHAKNNVKPAEAAPQEDVVTAQAEQPVTADKIVAETNVDQLRTEPEQNVKQSAAVPQKKTKIIDRIIKPDSPEDIIRIQSGSKAAAFKSGFKTGLKMMMPMPDADSHTNHLAIASFVLGIISLFAYYGAFVLGLLAVIFGIIAIHRIRKGEGTRGNTFAWIGLICGIIGIILATVIIQVI